MIFGNELCVIGYHSTTAVFIPSYPAGGIKLGCKIDVLSDQVVVGRVCAQKLPIVRFFRRWSITWKGTSNDRSGAKGLIGELLANVRVGLAAFKVDSGGLGVPSDIEKY